MLLSDFDYAFPSELLAKYPPEVRGQSRLLVLNRHSGHIEHRRYADFADYLSAGDVVVLNDTRVIKARLLTVNQADKHRELLLVERHGLDNDWHVHKCLYRGQISQGEVLTVSDAKIRIRAIESEGVALVESSQDLLRLAERNGSVPLPPYMKRQATEQDIERYQTVFAKQDGSVAAPTASLNFTNELKQTLATKGVEVVYLTLHVGLGTFLPIRTDQLEQHHMHSEYAEIPIKTVQSIKKAMKEKKKVVALGTTVARTLEFFGPDIINKDTKNYSGEVDIFIYPGYTFKVINALVTNFHAPKSTVLMLAAAFASKPKSLTTEERQTNGWDNLKRAYEEAIKEKYAFLSYGDSMLIL